MGETKELRAICEHAARQRLPRWSELPDLELYMDQVLSLVERYLGAYPGFDRKGLTAAMVNNYVKLGVMPPPAKKRYTRTHLAYLIMICVLKASLPIDVIRDLLAQSVVNEDKESVYDGFCETFEASVRDAAEGAKSDLEISGVYRAALRAQAEQALALKLYEAMRSERE